MLGDPVNVEATWIGGCGPEWSKDDEELPSVQESEVTNANDADYVKNKEEEEEE